jgi:hypothetical protein
MKGISPPKQLVLSSPSSPPRQRSGGLYRALLFDDAMEIVHKGASASATPYPYSFNARISSSNAIALTDTLSVEGSRHPQPQATISPRPKGYPETPTSSGIFAASAAVQNIRPTKSPPLAASKSKSSNHSSSSPAAPHSFALFAVVLLFSPICFNSDFSRHAKHHGCCRLH